MTSDGATIGTPTTWVRAEGGDESPLASAAAVVVGAERAIGRLWRDAVADGNADLSELLAELSHALSRAALVLDRSRRAIG
jgi:hypothetical protein